MKGLAITAEHLKNQQDVVKSEVRVNVLNRPYGGFPWLWMPQVANTRWENAHNFYGDLADIDAATLADAKTFFDTYYRPGNAAIAIVGDFEPEQALGWAKKYLGAVPAGAVPQKPDVSEPRQEAERRSVRVDSLAQRPALAFAYHTPPPETPDYFALLLAHQLLASGRDSALSLALVQQRGFTDAVDGEVHALGTPFNVEGPETWTVSLRHDVKTSADTILAVAEEEIAKLRDAKVSLEQLERAKTKARSDFYDLLESSNGFGKADLLAAYALFYDQPERINSIVSRYAAVTPEQLQKVAQEYLRPQARTVLVLEAGAAAAAKAGGAK